MCTNTPTETQPQATRTPITALLREMRATTKPGGIHSQNLVISPTETGSIALAILLEQAADRGLSKPLRDALQDVVNQQSPVVLDWGLHDEAHMITVFLESLPLDKALQAELLKVIDVAEILTAAICSLATQLIETADLCTAMHLEAVRGEMGAFDDRLHSLGRPYPGQIATAANVRRLLEGSEYTTDLARAAFGGDSGARVQDAISLRAVPQTHGAVRDAVSRLSESLACRQQREIGQRSSSLEFPLNLVGIALIDLANMSQHRSYRLLDTRMTYGLPMNLMAEDPGFNHGYPIVHTAAIAILAEMKLQAPRSNSAHRFDAVTGEVLNHEVEEAVSTLELLHYLRKVLAIELLMSAQAMDLVRLKLNDWKFGVGTTVAHEVIRTRVPYVAENRFMSDDMVAVEQLLASGAVNAAVEKEVGARNAE